MQGLRIVPVGDGELLRVVARGLRQLGLLDRIQDEGLFTSLFEVELVVGITQCLL